MRTEESVSRGFWSGVVVLGGMVIAALIGATPAVAVGSGSAGTVSAEAVGTPPDAPPPEAPRFPMAPQSVVATSVGGGVLPFGGAPFLGSLSGVRLNRPVVGMAATSDGRGYWLVASDGGVFSFGDARFFGSTGDVDLRKPVVGMAATSDGRGYWLVASDGGVFSFGDARFFGSTGDVDLRKPVVGMAATSDGRGYWLAASDGGVFSFGDARFWGSAARASLPEPVIGIVRDLASGYWLFEGQHQQQLADPFAPSLVATLHQRLGTITAAVLDLNTGALYMYTPSQQDITASIVKVQILGTLMAQAQAARRQLTPTERSLAASMIEVSDNDSATDLWNELGGAPAVASFDHSIGMTSTTPSTSWGLTVTTAADQITLLEHIVLPNAQLSTPSRAFMLSLMESVTPSQAWGVSAGAVPGTTVALKNGWLPVGSTWQVNSVGWIAGSGRNYLISVLTSGDPTESYGIDSISLVADAAWQTLGAP